MIDGLAPVEIFDEVDSTMLEARRRAERGETGPVWLVARRQTEGRGRRGRSWLSGEGNLLTTYLFATDRPPAEMALLGFAAGLAIAETLEASGAQGQVRLKWPNDVMIDGAKTAGILLESGPRQDGGIWVALAFGVNIAAAPEELDQPVTCLHAALPAGAKFRPTEADFFMSVRPKLEDWSLRLEREGFEPLRQAWLARAYGLGQSVRVQQGDAQIEGRLVGISPRGELELETDVGTRLIAAGDVLISNGS